MDFGFSEEQEMFRKTVHGFLKKECPLSLVREIEEKKQDYDRNLYRKMAEMGWPGMLIPEEYGGYGGNWIDMAIFYEEAGRALLQSPHFSTSILGAQTILTFGNEEQKKRLLPEVAKGGLILSLALAEAEISSNLSLLTTSASPKGEDYIINGSKLFAINAHLADYIITVIRTENGITLFLVDSKASGLTSTPLDTLSGERLNQVIYNNVVVSNEDILGEVGKGEGVADIVEKGKLISCAEMIGGARAALEMAVDYSKIRYQFGRPIGSFQSLQHKMSEMTLSLEGARWLVYNAAWMISEGIPCARESAMAQLEIGRLYTRISSEAIHIQGGVAIMQEHDLPFYYRRAKAAQLNLGYADEKREIIAQGIGI